MRCTAWLALADFLERLGMHNSFKGLCISLTGFAQSASSYGSNVGVRRHPVPSPTKAQVKIR